MLCRPTLYIYYIGNLGTSTSKTVSHFDFNSHAMDCATRVCKPGYIVLFCMWQILVRMKLIPLSYLIMLKQSDNQTIVSSEAPVTGWTLWNDCMTVYIIRSNIALHAMSLRLWCTTARSVTLTICHLLGLYTILLFVTVINVMLAHLCHYTT